MRSLLAALFYVALVAPAHGAIAPFGSAPARNAEYLSFAELYRITVSGVSDVEFSAAALDAQSAPASAPSSAQSSEYQVRVASSDAPAPVASIAPAHFTFSLPLLPEPSSRWLLVASALALVAWVARRRLGYAL